MAELHPAELLTVAAIVAELVAVRIVDAAMLMWTGSSCSISTLLTNASPVVMT
jgi:hypothetical protein